MDYIITAHKGAGKSKLAVSEAVESYLMKGKRVASNITINLDRAMPIDSKVTMIKLPYIPSKEHLDALGNGYPELDPMNPGTYDEEKFGLIILDEAGTWLNAREWNDKERKGLFTWLTQARKYGWDVFTIIQDPESLDAQIRRSIMEVHVQCSRLDRVKIPYFPINLPRIFRATARYGGPNGSVYKRWHAGDKANTWYRTGESIRPEILYSENTVQDMRANFSLLSCWHLAGRYLPKPTSRWNLLGIYLKWAYRLTLGRFSSPACKAGDAPLLRLIHRDLAKVYPRMLIGLNEIPYPHLKPKHKPVGNLLTTSFEEYNRMKLAASITL